MLHIYNTLTKTKTLFKPLKKGKVNMYVCGMTVYDYCHIGHARVMTAFDVIYRYLLHLGYQVNYIRNITDIDDKIIQRAKENNEHYLSLTERFIQAMREDEKALNILPPSNEPCATQHIDQMIKAVQSLLNKKFAYIGASGDVYYSVRRFPAYGALSHQNIEKLRSGARVSIVEAKEDALDFVLWKLAKPGEPAWESPWGKGRPGWHIECSAMSIHCLGEQIDIHGGGFDLIFPHHQNEIAQSESLTGKTFADTWMHVGFVTVNKEKMSKSLGNFFTIRQVFKQYPPEVIRYFMLTSHYRSPLNYSVDLLNQSQAALERLYLSLRDFCPDPVSDLKSENNAYAQRFHEALEDDFNTPQALSVLFDLARDINKLREKNPQKAAAQAAILKTLGKLLGIFEQDPDVFLKNVLQTDKIPIEKEDAVEKLIQVRNEARKAKNWALADEIRKKLEQKGILIEDDTKKTRWRRLTAANASLK